MALGSIALESLVNFYSQLLGQKPQPYQPGVYAEFQLPGLRLAIFLPKPDHQAEFGQSGIGDQAGDRARSVTSRDIGSKVENKLINQSASISICLQVPNLSEVIKELQAINYPVGNIITASHGQELYIYDPDGNRLIFYAPKRDIS